MNANARLLVDAALVAARNAYAPYSKYCVGASLLTNEGRIIVGCNVENSSYGLSMCAERNAIFAAVSMGARIFTAIAVVTEGSEIPYPCGACRQVLSEFCGPLTPVYLFASSGPPEVTSLTMGTLFPHPFAKDKPS